MRSRVSILLLAYLHVSHALLNSALVFIKPHAATDACETFVRERLATAGVSIVSSGKKVGTEIDERKLIDQHYGSLAQLAMETSPEMVDLSPAARASFADTYGIEWEAAPMLRNGEALDTLKVDGKALETLWRQGVQLKLAPGTYVSKLALADRDLFTLNGFYPAMRQAFVEPSAEVRYMVCEFDENELSWRSFRQQVIGATDPTQAVAGSMRAEVLDRWQELGLASAPTQGLNGVHASAGPLEGLKERCVWAGATVDADAFSSHLVAGGIERSTLEQWLADNPVVTLGGETDKVFDLTEELGAKTVLEMVLAGAAPKANIVGDGAPPPAGFVWGDVF